MNSKQLLLIRQVRSYLMLAKSLESDYYLSRAKKTMELFYAERRKHNYRRAG